MSSGIEYETSIHDRLFKRPEATTYQDCRPTAASSALWTA